MPEPPLSDGRVTLRLTAERDIPEILIAYEDDRHLHDRLGESRPPSGADLGRASEEAQALRLNGVRVQLTITTAGSDICRGVVTLHEFAWEHARAEILLWVAPAQRGHGYATAALRLVSAWAFTSCGLVRLSALIEPDDGAMCAAAAAAGFVDEGVLRAYRPVDRGRRRVDVAVYARLATDGEPA